MLSGFLRISTSRRVFVDPTPLRLALDFVETLRSLPHCRSVRPGDRHWAIFTTLCAAARARGKLVADAYHAAIAIEHGLEWIRRRRRLRTLRGASLETSPARTGRPAKLIRSDRDRIRDRIALRSVADWTTLG